MTAAKDLVEQMMLPLPAEPVSVVRLRVVVDKPRRSLLSRLPPRLFGPGVRLPKVPLRTRIAARRFVARTPLTRAECRTWTGPCGASKCTWNSSSLPPSGYVDTPRGRCMLTLAELGSQGEATLDDVGEALGCTREAVRQTEVRALRKLGFLKAGAESIDDVQEAIGAWVRQQQKKSKAKGNR